MSLSSTWISQVLSEHRAQQGHPHQHAESKSQQPEYDYGKWRFFAVDHDRHSDTYLLKLAEMVRRHAAGGQDVIKV